MIWARWAPDPGLCAPGWWAGRARGHDLGVALDTIDELAGRVRRWVALEEALFEALGQWSRTADEPVAKRAFATWCHRHAWHAELWRDRLPVYQGRVGAPALEARLAAETEAWIEPLRRALTTAGTTDTAAKVAALAEAIVPAMSAALDEHRAAVDERLDGPTARLLTLVEADLDAERAALRLLGGNALDPEGFPFRSRIE